MQRKQNAPKKHVINNNAHNQRARAHWNKTKVLKTTLDNNNNNSYHQLYLYIDNAAPLHVHIDNKFLLKAMLCIVYFVVVVDKKNIVIFRALPPVTFAYIIHISSSSSSSRCRHYYNNSAHTHTTLNKKKKL